MLVTALDTAIGRTGYTLGFTNTHFYSYLFAAGPLREYPKNSPAGVIEMEASSQLTPEGAASRLHDVMQLDDSQSDQAVISREAVVLGADV